MRESLLVSYFFCVLGIKSKALQILGKSFITEKVYAENIR